MDLTRNDVYGLILVAMTVGLLVVHGAKRHDTPTGFRAAPADTIRFGRVVQANAGNAGSVVFVGVNVVYDDDTDPRSNQVVVVVDGQVTAMGPRGSVDTPPGAVVVRGADSDFLVPATLLTSGEAAGIDPWGRLVRGARMDLALLSGDPRLPVPWEAEPQGLLLDGVWFPVPAPRSPAGAASTTLGGH